jgi:hypothetical protein
LRAAIIQVLNEMPDATLDDQCVRFNDLMGINPPLGFESHSRTFINGVRDLKRTRTKARNDAADAIFIRERADALKVQIILLNLPMPNGKPMRKCTGVEMGGFGRAFTKIAERAGERMVGDVLSEEQVRKLIQKGKQ